ncbi:hypothetical protein DFH09DRAFT_1337123 [Mycena vulgaris]|nr:hypothetical protein DFH09DRAFT_1337123 [Mycena vulgaris]
MLLEKTDSAVARVLKEAIVSAPAARSHEAAPSRSSGMPALFMSSREGNTISLPIMQFPAAGPQLQRRPERVPLGAGAGIHVLRCQPVMRPAALSSAPTPPQKPQRVRTHPVPTSASGSGSDSNQAARVPFLSQEWKAILPRQAVLPHPIKEFFNTKYPYDVYRRCPNNTRKRRKPEASSSSGGDTDDTEISPDGEDATLLPDAHRYPYAVERCASARIEHQAHVYGHVGGMGDVYCSPLGAHLPQLCVLLTHVRRQRPHPARSRSRSRHPRAGPRPRHSSGATSSHSASNSNHSNSSRHSTNSFGSSYCNPAPGLGSSASHSDNSNGSTSSSGSSAGYYAPPSSASISAAGSYGSYAPSHVSASYPSHSSYLSHSPAYTGSAQSPAYSASPAYTASHSPRFDAPSPVYASSRSASPRGRFDAAHSPHAAAGLLDPTHSLYASYLTTDVLRSAALGSYSG